MTAKPKPPARTPLSEIHRADTRLAYGITVRRRLRCKRAGTHQDNYPARCKNCGVTP